MSPAATFVAEPTGGSRRAMSAQRRRRLRRTLSALAALVTALLVLVTVRLLTGTTSTGTPPSAAAPAAATQTASGGLPPAPGPTGSPGAAPSAPATAGAAPSRGAPAVANPAVPPMGDEAGQAIGSAVGDAAVVSKGSGAFTALDIPGEDNRSGGREVRFTVEVEGGLEADAAQFAQTVGQVLRDPRGWEQADRVTFSAVSPQRAANGIGVAVRVTLASPDSVDRLCYPLETKGEVSCFANGRAVINQRRWHTGASSYAADLASYREYLINHEVGHALGHGHVTCPAAGAKAPIMLQQTLGLHGCHAWPYPVPAD